MPLVPVTAVGSSGINRDVSAVLLPPNTWSDGRNVKFADGSVSKRNGHESLFDTDQNIEALTYWPRPLTPAYIYSTDATVFRRNGDGSVATIGANFSTADNAKWQFSIYNGGYTVIANNRVDAPRYITYGTSGASDETSLQVLPGWPTGLSAGVVRPAGYTLIAGNLTDTSGAVTNFMPGTIRISSQAAPGGVPASWTVGSA